MILGQGQGHSDDVDPHNISSDPPKGYTTFFKLPKNLAGQKRRGKNIGAVFLDVFSLPEFRSGISLAPKNHNQPLPNWMALIVRNCSASCDQPSIEKVSMWDSSTPILVSVGTG
jgi:hypothetical protein